MPGQRVDLGPNGVYLSIPSMPGAANTVPATPSPSFSEASLPSTDGPYTPYDGAYAPLPSPSGTSSAPAPPPAFHIHSALGFRPGVPLPIFYDVAHPPSAVGFNMLYDATRAERVLREPATSPPCGSMVLVCDLLPYAVPVAPGAAAAGGAAVPPPGAAPYVSVHDVLAALYAFLRTPLAPAEFARLPAPQQATVAAAFAARCTAAAAGDALARERERAKGVKRVDLLAAAGRTRFGGLGATKSGAWVLNLE